MTRNLAVALLAGVVSFWACAPSPAARLPGCARGAVEPADIYAYLQPGDYLLEQYAKTLLRLRDHVAAAAKVRRDEPIAATVVQETDHKLVRVVLNFHESAPVARAFPDGRLEADPASGEQSSPPFAMPSRCVLRIGYGKLGDLDFHYVGPAAERFISDVMFAGIYTDQHGERWQIHNGLAITPTQSFTYEFGIDLVGDPPYWKDGLLLKDKDSHEQYEAYLGRGRKVEVFVYEDDENAHNEARRKRVWTLRRARGRE